MLDVKNWDVLVVDDEPDNLTLLECLLLFHDARPTCARSGTEALKLLKEGTYKLALFDVQMPRVTGWDLIKAVRGSDNSLVREMPVIAVTALAMPGDEQRVLDAGFDGYLAKPIDAETFVNSVQQIIEAPRSRNALKAQTSSLVDDDSLSGSDKISRIIREAIRATRESEAIAPREEVSERLGNPDTAPAQKAIEKPARQEPIQIVEPPTTLADTRPSVAKRSAIMGNTALHRPDAAPHSREDRSAA